jgi:hypothetical protein
MRKIFNFPKKIWAYLKKKLFVLFYFIAALVEYWFAPMGARGGIRSRLRELPAESDQEGVNQPRKIALFVGFTPRLTLSNKAYIKTLRAAGFALVYLSNCPLDASARQDIGNLAWRLFERHNLGRDVGAYRDGVLWLEQQGLLTGCEILLIANDSMQFLPGGYADALVQALQDFESSSDVGLFSHISQSHDAHYQSYFQALKRPIFSSRLFLDFWRNYLPLSHRGHCIFKGEIALSAQVYRKFHNVRVLYTSEALQATLENLQSQHGDISAGEILRLMPSPARTVQRRKVGYCLDQILQQSTSRETLAGWQLYCLADVIENNNPSHVAAFLYPIYLHCPLVKQDLCVAGSFTIAQALSLFREALTASAQSSKEEIDVEAHVKEFSKLLYAKGTPLSYISKAQESALKGITGGFVYSATYDGNL